MSESLHHLGKQKSWMPGTEELYAGMNGNGHNGCTDLYMEQLENDLRARNAIIDQIKTLFTFATLYEDASAYLVDVAKFHEIMDAVELL